MIGYTKSPEINDVQGFNLVFWCVLNFWNTKIMLTKYNSTVIIC